MVTDGGFNPLEEAMSSLGIPVMSKQSFMLTECQIGDWWWSSLQELMKASGKEERQYAMEKIATIRGYLLLLLLLMEDGVSVLINICTMHYLALV